MTTAANKQGADRVIETFGARPNQVTVTTRDIRGTRAIVVEWRELGKRRMWKTTATNKRDAIAQAKAFAKVKATVLQQRAQVAANDYTPPAPKTWLELVAAYVAAEGGDWADNTRRNVAARVKYFTLFFGGHTAAERATLETMLDFRAALRVNEHEPAEINRITTTIKAIFAFGVRNDLLVSKVPLFVAKKIRAHQKRKIPAFSPTDVFAILSEMKPRGAVKQNEPQRPWRPWAISLLACLTSKRAKSQILPLLKEDVQWRRGGASVRWRAENNKTRTEQLQPMPRRAAALLRVVLWLLRREGYSGPLLFPAMETKRVRVKGRPYSYTSVHFHLVQACTRADVTRAKGQALHAYRRYAANAILTATGGNLKSAGQLLNDVDLGVISRDYVREGDGEQAEIARLMPKPDKAAKGTMRERVKGTDAGVSQGQDAGSGSTPPDTSRGRNSEPTANASAVAEASEDVTV